MTTGTFTQDLTVALTGHAKFLSKARKVSMSEAWGIVAATARENIDASYGSDDGIAYWRAALAIAERHRVSESDPRWSK